MNLMVSWVLALSLAPFPTWADVDVKSAVDRLVEAVVENRDVGTALRPKDWTDKLNTTSLDLNKLLKTDFPEGIPYGAIATQTIDVPYERVRALLLDPEGSYRLVTSVKTMRNFQKLSESEGQVRLRMSIKVPVVSDFKTEVLSHSREVAKTFTALEWKQAGDFGDLTYNQGAVVAEPMGEKTKMLVIGIHILKPERKVPWLGRGTAKSFAKTHYGNFIEALRSALNGAAGKPG